MINQHNAGDLSRSVLFVRGATFSICFHSIQALLVTTEGNSFIFDNKRSSLVIKLKQDWPRSEGYDEYIDPPLESKYECPICLLDL